MGEIANLEVGLKISDRSVDAMVNDIEKKLSNKLGSGMGKGGGAGAAPKGKAGGGLLQSLSGGGGLFGGISKMIQGAISALGPIGVAIVAIGAVVMTMKPLVNMVKIILRLLTELLRPIADVILVLLMPILAILKPIVKVVQAIMMPFRKAAMQMAAQGMKQIAGGDVAGGLATSMGAFNLMFTGLQMIIFEMISEIMKMLMELQGFLVKALTAPMFFIAGLIAKLMDSLLGTGTMFQEMVTNAQSMTWNAIDSIVNLGKATIDNFFGGVIMTNLALLENTMMTLLGPDGNAMINLEEMGKMLDGIFQDSTVSFADLGKQLEDANTEIGGVFGLFEANISDLATIWSTVMGQMGDDLKSAIANALSGIPSGGGKGDEKGLFQRAADWVRGHKGTVIGAGIGMAGAGIPGAIAGGVIGSRFNDFVMRPGQKAVPFSPQDTLIGTKGGLPGAGGSGPITINISAGQIGRDTEVRALAAKLADNLNREMQRRSSY